MKAIRWTFQTIALIGFGAILSPGLAAFVLMYLDDRIKNREHRERAK